ncbi:MAG: type 2 isopentenyl-diphosphate Delta-isomerase [Brevundimonas sp.]|nr:MAG: type 2 isopentenyl-diphosphate Delta-isomerase [Brevundimonas sp.]
MSDIVARKDQHLDVILSGRARHGRDSGLDAVRFVHEALPDLDYGKIDLGADFLGRRLKAPLLISSMTGGPARAEVINARLAEAAQHLGIALAVGSQRAALEALVRTADFPVVVKETGAGLSAATCQRLAAMGVAGLDVAGAGGSNWALVEGERAEAEADKAHAAAFADWGLPTARAIVEARAACPRTLIIGSGGIRDGVDAAKAIRLGADMVGQAAGVLAAATVSTEAVVTHFQTVIRQMKTVCFCTGSANLTALARAPLQD